MGTETRILGKHALHFLLEKGKHAMSTIAIDVFSMTMIKLLLVTALGSFLGVSLVWITFLNYQSCIACDALFYRRNLRNGICRRCKGSQK